MPHKSQASFRTATEAFIAMQSSSNRIRNELSHLRVAVEAIPALVERGRLGRLSRTAGQRQLSKRKPLNSNDNGLDQLAAIKEFLLVKEHEISYLEKLIEDSIWLTANDCFYLNPDVLTQ